MSAVIPFPQRAISMDPSAAVACVAEIQQAIHLMRRQRRLERATRTKLEELVAQLIDIVDRLDGDPDLEDGGDIDFAWPESEGRGSRMRMMTNDDDEDGGDIEGTTDDNGIGDEDGLWEQRRR